MEANHCPLLAANYKVAAKFGLIADFMVPSPMLVDTGAIMNLIHVNFLPKKWLAKIKPLTGNKLITANKSSLYVIGVICLCLKMRDLKVMIRFGVVRKLVNRVLVGTPFIDIFVKDIFPPERKIFPVHSRPVHVMANNQPEMIMPPAHDKRAISPLDAPLEMTTAALELCTLQNTDDNRVCVAKFKWMMPWSRTPSLVRCSTPGLIIITPFDKPLKKRLCIAA